MTKLTERLLERELEAWDGTKYSEDDTVDVITTSGAMSTVVGKNPDGSYKTLRGKIKKEQIKPEYFEKLNRFSHE